MSCCLVVESLLIILSTIVRPLLMRIVFLSSIIPILWETLLKEDAFLRIK